MYVFFQSFEYDVWQMEGQIMDILLSNSPVLAEGVGYNSQ